MSKISSRAILGDFFCKQEVVEEVVYMMLKKRKDSRIKITQVLVFIIGPARFELTTYHLGDRTSQNTDRTPNRTPSTPRNKNSHLA